MLHALEPALPFTIVEPCVQGPDCLPDGATFADFDGVAWTGSALSMYEDDPMNSRQLRMADIVFAAGAATSGYSFF